MPETTPLAPATAALLAQASTATLTSQLLRRGITNTFMAGLGPMHPGQRMVGTARTLRYVPMRGGAEGLNNIMTGSVNMIIDGYAALEGTMKGVDRALYAELACRTTHSIYASGGVGSSDDLALLQDLGIHAAIIGMALYTGALDASAIAKIYGASSATKGRT